jgi:hypothetical protein
MHGDVILARSQPAPLPLRGLAGNRTFTAADGDTVTLTNQQLEALRASYQQGWEFESSHVCILCMCVV